MLDIERKLLRIIYNFSHTNKRMPMINELERKTGRTKANILSALLHLEQEGYIVWEKGKLESIQIIKPWEKIETKPLWRND